NNSVTFSGRAKRSEDFLNRMVEALGINKKNGCALILIIYPIEKPLFTRLSDPLQECPKNARRMPLNASQFSKKRQFTTLFLGYFHLPKIRKSL
ncbi:MAG: hypothetical protein U9O91_03735, partial [Candidatus Caldatribacteriota bacterium]|nr:hypothetical protein [Candidatus Caldatribacteriota bacterium]